MNPYKKGIKLEDHSLEQVFNALGVAGEVKFVEKFFGEEEIRTVVEACGLNPQGPIERTLEHKIQVGFATKRADLTFEDDGNLYYLEVMSQANKGRWDNEHHEQFYLKQARLRQQYDQVYSFAIAFKEFDTVYLDEFSKMEDSYAIHLRFNDDGYFADVYGVEEKKRAVSVKLASLEELGNKLVALGKAAGLPFRRSEVQSVKYIYVGHGYKTTRLGIEWVMYPKRNDQLGIKLHNGLGRYAGAESSLTLISDDTAAAINFLSSKVPNVEFNPSKCGFNDNTGTIKFNFDCTDLSKENIQTLVDITKAFAEYCGLSNLLDA